jgi:hypothetical protein
MQNIDLFNDPEDYVYTAGVDAGTYFQVDT